MLDSSQKMLEFLAPLAAVVYIIVAVIAFLLRNQERLEHEIEQERRDALPENPAARPRAGSGHQGGRPTVVLPSETEGGAAESRIYTMRPSRIRMMRPARAPISGA